VGQWRLLHARQPVGEILADPATDALLRERLELVERTRRFAAELDLEVDGQYRSYVDWPGDRVVTTVVATRPGELDPAGFWFPLIGRLPYKGFFAAERAEREAARLRSEDMDVCVVPVRAYSTLGWFDDPVTGPMLRLGLGQLVETLLHELVHATVYLRADADFNEGVATFIGEEGSVRFYTRAGEPELAAARRREVEQGRRLDALVLALRDRVKTLYAETEPGPQRDSRRTALEQETRLAIAALPLEPQDPAELAERIRLNDACLALAATYTADLARYAARLAELDGDLAAFVARLRAVADAEDPRTALLGP